MTLHTCLFWFGKHVSVIVILIRLVSFALIVIVGFSRQGLYAFVHCAVQHLNTTPPLTRSNKSHTQRYWGFQLYRFGLSKDAWCEESFTGLEQCKTLLCNFQSEYYYCTGKRFHWLTVKPYNCVFKIIRCVFWRVWQITSFNSNLFKIKVVCIILCKTNCWIEQELKPSFTAFNMYLVYLLQVQCTYILTCFSLWCSGTSWSDCTAYVSDLYESIVWLR